MHIEKLEYSVGEKSFVGHLAHTAARGRRRPGVLVCHDAGGLRDRAVERANRLAELGYVAYALDLFGEPITGTEHAKATILSLTGDLPTFRARLNAGLAALCSRPEVGPARTAAIGFCFGGTAALELARSGADVACAVAFHGVLGTAEPGDARNIRGKVLACIGARDPLVPAPQRAAFIEEMTSAGVDFQMLLLNAVHGFTDKTSDEHGVWALAYDERADRRSWRAMLNLFDEALGPP